MTTVIETDIGAIAERMRLARRLAGLTQQQVAYRLRVAEKTVARWEKGLTSGFLRDPGLNKIAPVYKTTAAHLLNGEEPAAGAIDAIQRQLLDLTREIKGLRQLLLDPDRLRAEADRLIAEEGERVPTRGSRRGRRR